AIPAHAPFVRTGRRRVSCVGVPPTDARNGCSSVVTTAPVPRCRPRAPSRLKLGHIPPECFFGSRQVDGVPVARVAGDPRGPSTRGGATIGEAGAAGHGCFFIGGGVSNTPGGHSAP